MSPPGKTVRAPRREALLYLAKAEQFADEATDALASSRYDAAMLNAVHAAISGADAACVAVAGIRSADPDHQRAATLLEQVGAGALGFSDASKRLRILLGKKNSVEYESRATSKSAAADAVTRARRFVTWSAEIVNSANL